MPYLPMRHLQTIKDRTLQYQSIRRDVITQSGNALHAAKKAIFALHRGDIAPADDYIALATSTIATLAKTHKRSPQFMQEGAFEAAVEELVEATLLHRFLEHKSLQPLKGIPVADHVFIAGLADVPGELYRYSLKMGTERNIAEVEHAHQLAEEIVEALIEFDLTKHLRNKFDQAKAALHKIESVRYELTIAGDRRG